MGSTFTATLQQPCEIREMLIYYLPIEEFGFGTQRILH